MATIEDVLQAVGRLGEQVAEVQAEQRELRAAQRELRTALDHQERELRHHMDHAIAQAVGALRRTVESRFDALGAEILVLTASVNRLSVGEQARREIDHGLLAGLQGLRGRVERLEDRLGDGLAPPPPPPAPS